MPSPSSWSRQQKPLIPPDRPVVAPATPRLLEQPSKRQRPQRSIGQEIERWREARGLSQGQLAERVGIDRSLVSRMESGMAPDPRVSVLNAIATVLDVPPYTLLGAAGPVRASDPRVLMRELNLQLQAALPIQVPEAGFTVGEKDTPGMQHEPASEPWPYHPTLTEEGHRFSAVRVVGDALAPAFVHGDVLFVDLDEPPVFGDTVVARPPGALVNEPAALGVLAEAADGSPILHPVGGGTDRPLGPALRLWGVVTQKMSRMTRGPAAHRRGPDGASPDGVARP